LEAPPSRRIENPTGLIHDVEYTVRENRSVDREQLEVGIAVLATKLPDDRPSAALTMPKSQGSRNQSETEMLQHLTLSLRADNPGRI
jgi:hypothetical protein